MEPEVAFGKVLRALRKQAGLSQEQLALDADLQRNYISLLERGLNSASIKTLFKLAAPLKTSPSQMLEQTEQLRKRSQRGT
ncbi:TPA: helix-turn-helix transcriptional regulator [Stenotrophomonas maltophilia]|nr:helix-turn-helix transcriptional regulator [Stenotrophomonas maltophilia]MBH1711306.1 helix-turn-helix transcriptional regulator [Stenotrophomonas maltophilia]HEL3759492.1 helix-turn-helix transcriptional regulator [Stenotrophomonas maltophilia]